MKIHGMAKKKRGDIEEKVEYKKWNCGIARTRGWIEEQGGDL